MRRIPIAFLYKQHEHAECDKLLSVIRYLHASGFDAIADQIQERDLPANVQLPTVKLATGAVLTGYYDILQYLQDFTDINDLDSKADDFKRTHPKYTIRTFGASKSQH